MTKEEFNSIWKDTSREGILNQFYYDYCYMQKLKNILNIIEQHCLDEQMPEEYLEYSAFVEVQNMVYEGIYNKIQELRGGIDE